MDLFSELIAALQSDLNVSTNSSLFPLATIKLALNRAYRKASRLFKWPALHDAKKTSTAVDQDYYDAPEVWTPNSMWRLEVNGDLYGEDPDGSPMAFEDYLSWKQDNPTSTKKKWAVQWLRYFISPTPTTVISNGIHIWGQKNVTTLSADGDTTIFSYNSPECNEALVLEAKAILKNKGNAEKSAEMASMEAKAILAVSFNKLRQESAKYEKIQPFFHVPDFYGKGNSKSTIGNFDFNS